MDFDDPHQLPLTPQASASEQHQHREKMMDYHSKIRRLREQGSSSSTNTTFPCHLCFRKFSKLTDLINHRKTVHFSGKTSANVSSSTTTTSSTLSSKKAASDSAVGPVTKPTSPSDDASSLDDTPTPVGRTRDVSPTSDGSSRNVSPTQEVDPTQGVGQTQDVEPTQSVVPTPADPVETHKGDLRNFVELHKKTLAQDEIAEVVSSDRLWAVTKLIGGHDSSSRSSVVASSSPMGRPDPSHDPSVYDDHDEMLRIFALSLSLDRYETEKELESASKPPASSSSGGRRATSGVALHCCACDARAASQRELAEHYDRAHPRQYFELHECRLCYSWFRVRADCLAHLRTEHPDQEQDLSDTRSDGLNRGTGNIHVTHSYPRSIRCIASYIGITVT